MIIKTFLAKRDVKMGHSVSIDSDGYVTSSSKNFIGVVSKVNNGKADVILSAPTRVSAEHIDVTEFGSAKRMLISSYESAEKSSDAFREMAQKFNSARDALGKLKSFYEPSNKAKCTYCGQWGERYSECGKCGGAID